MPVDDRTGDLTRSIEMLDTAQRRFESLLNRSMSRISTKLDDALGSTRSRRSDRSARAAAAAVLSPTPSGFSGGDVGGELRLTGRSAQLSSASGSQTSAIGGRIAKAGAAALTTALGSPVARQRGTARTASTTLSSHRSERGDHSARSSAAPPAAALAVHLSPERAGAGLAVRRATAVMVLRRLRALLQQKGLRVHELYVDRRLNQQDFTRPDLDAKKRRPSQFCDMTDYVRGAWAAPDQLDHSRQTWSVFFGSMRKLGMTLTAGELRDVAWYMQNTVASRNKVTGDVYNPAHLRTDVLEEALHKVEHADALHGHAHTRAGARGYHESAALTKALQKALQLRDGGNDVVLGGRGNDATGYDYDQDIEFGSDAGAKARAKRQRQRLAHMHNLTGQRFGLRHQARQPPKRSIQLAGRGQVG